MEQSKMSIWEIVKLNLRGLKFIEQQHKRGSIPLAVFIGIMNAVSYYWNLWILALLVDDLQAGAAGTVLFRDMALLSGGALVMWMVKCVSDHIFFCIGSNIWEKSNILLNRKMMDMDYEYMESEKIQNQRRDLDEMSRTYQGGGINFLFWRVEAVVRTTTNIFITIFYLIQMLGKNVGVSKTHFIQTVITGILFAVFIVGILFASMRQISRWKEMLFQENDQIIPVKREHTWYVDNYLEKEAAGKNIRLFQQQQLLQKHLYQLFERITEKVKRSSAIEEKMKLLTGVLQAGLLSLVYFYLGTLALGGFLSVGNVILYAGSIGVFINCFSEWVFLLTEVATNSRYLKAFFAFLDIPNKKYEGTLKVEKRDDDRFELEFRHVFFKYPGSSQYVLKDFSIRFRIGERLAVVGRNGSGKTTFIKLLCRLYDPTEGEILLNGIDIRKYDYQEYLSLFGVVFQDFQLLSMPLGENIAARMDYDEDKVKRALFRMGMEKYVTCLEKGLHTILYKDFDGSGVAVSGGEAQKLAMARTLYRDAPFMILDEPTTALDPLAEYEVYSGFDELVGTKTAVYISHRLSSCQFCNDILVIEEGQAVQRGSHKELVQDQNGLYYKLWNAQAQYYNK